MSAANILSELLTSDVLNSILNPYLDLDQFELPLPPAVLTHILLPYLTIRDQIILEVKSLPLGEHPDQNYWLHVLETENPKVYNRIMNPSKPYLTALLDEFTFATEETRLILIMCGLYRLGNQIIFSLQNGDEIVVYTRLADVSPDQILKAVYDQLTRKGDFATLNYLLQRSPPPSFKIFFHLLDKGAQIVSSHPELAADFNQMKDYLTQAVYPSDIWSELGGDEFTTFTYLVKSNPDVVTKYIRNGSVDLATIDDLDETLQTVVLNTDPTMNQAYLDLFETLIKVDPTLVNMPIYPHSQFPGAKTTLQVIREEQERGSRFANQLYDIAINV